MYIDHADAGRAAGTIVFENAPPSDFFVEAGVETAKDILARMEELWRVAKQA